MTDATATTPCTTPCTIAGDAAPELRERAERLVNDPSLGVYGVGGTAFGGTGAVVDDIDVPADNLTTLCGEVWVDTEEAAGAAPVTLNDNPNVVLFRVDTASGGARGGVHADGVYVDLGAPVALALLFTYTLECVRSSQRTIGADQRRCYRAARWSVEPRRLTRRAVEHVVLRHTLHLSDVARGCFWSSAAQEEPPLDPAASVDALRAHLRGLQGPHGDGTVLVRRLHAAPPMRRYLLHREYVQLERWFPQATLAVLDYHHVLTLHYRTTVMPHRLVFRHFMAQPPTQRVVTSRLRPLERTRRAPPVAPPPLGELTVERADTIAAAYSLTVAERDRAAAMAFECVRDETEHEQHAMTPVRTVFKCVSARLRRGDHTTAAMSRPAAANAAKCGVEYAFEIGGLHRLTPDVTDDGVAEHCAQLVWVADAERAFIDALEHLVRRVTNAAAAAAVDTMCVDETRSVATAMRVDAPTGACDEQQCAWTALRRHPVTVVDGPGGSGKSELVRMLTSHDRVPAEWVMSTALTSAACVNLMESSHRRAWNNHVMLAAHSRLCWHTKAEAMVRHGRHDECEAAAKQRLTEGYWLQWRSGACANVAYHECPLERCRVLVIEESSLEHVSTLGPLLLAMVACSTRLERILFIGDHRQLPPVRWGYLWRQLLEMPGGDGGSVVRFTHNHRVRGTAAHQLTENAVAVHAMRASDVVFGGAECADTAAVQVDPTQTEYGATFHEKRAAVEHDAATVMCRFALDELAHQWVTRTNMMREMLNETIERHYLEHEGALDARHPYSSRAYYVGRKHAFDANLNEWSVSHNEVLVLLAVEDVRFPTAEDITGRHWYLSVTPDYSMPHVRSALSDAQSAVAAATDNATGDVAAEVRRIEARDKMQSGGVVDVVTHTSTVPHVDRGRVRFLLFQTLDSVDFGAARRRRVDAPPPTPQYRRVPYAPEVVRHLRKAGAITVHGYQGRQTPTLVYYMPYFARFDTRESVYTALTRAMERTVVVATRHDLRRAIENPEPRRREALGHRLRRVLDPHDDTCEEDTESDEERGGERANKRTKMEVTTTTGATVEVDARDGVTS